MTRDSETNVVLTFPTTRKRRVRNPPFSGRTLPAGVSLICDHPNYGPPPQPRSIKRTVDTLLMLALAQYLKKHDPVAFAYIERSIVILSHKRPADVVVSDACELLRSI